MKLIISNTEHFTATLAYAKSQPKETKRTFLRSISTINRLKRNLETDEVHIYPDWVDHSFGWSFIKDGKCVYNGGMILHGFQQTFSVELNPKSYPHWSIHT